MPKTPNTPNDPNAVSNFLDPDPGDGDTVQQISPWEYEAADYQNNVIRIRAFFVPLSRALLSVEVYRHPACVYKKILIGLGADGIPDNTPHAITVPAGTTIVSALTLSQNGLNTIEDILKHQITAGF